MTLNTKNKFFAVTGCFRSGNTLMRLCLNSHSRVECNDEHTSYNGIQNALHGERWGAADLVGFKVPRLAPMMPLYLNANPEMRAIWMLRNPLPVVASLLKMNAFYINSHIGMPQPEFVRQFNNASETDKPFLSAIYIWIRCSRAFVKTQQSEYKKTIGVDYNTLVKSPEAELAKVLSFLDLDWQDAVLKHHLTEHTEALNGRLPGGTSPKRAMDTYSLRLWESELPARRVEIVRDMTSDLVEKINHLGFNLGEI